MAAAQAADAGWQCHSCAWRSSGNPGRGSTDWRDGMWGVVKKRGEKKYIAHSPRPKEEGGTAPTVHARARAHKHTHTHNTHADTASNGGPCSLNGHVDFAARVPVLLPR